MYCFALTTAGSCRWCAKWVVWQGIVFALYVEEGEVEQEVVGNCGGEMNVLILLPLCVYTRTVMFKM